MTVQQGWTPTFTTAKELAEMEIAAPRYAVDGFIPEGLAVVAGAPKLGKSFLVHDLGLAVALGRPFLGRQPSEAGDVLYLALEDPPYRAQERLETLLRGADAPAGLVFCHDWPRFDDGGLGHLEGWIDEHPGARLVVVDTWAKVAPVRARSNANAYTSDYADLGRVQKLALDHHIAIVVVHHTRKAEAEDVLAQVSGSTGITAAADAVLILKRGRAERESTLYVTGRDLVEERLPLTFDGGLWSPASSAARPYERSAQRRAVIEAMGTVGGVASPTELAAQLGIEPNAAKQRLWTMANDDREPVTRRGDGCYELTDNSVTADSRGGNVVTDNSVTGQRGYDGHLACSNGHGYGGQWSSDSSAPESTPVADEIGARPQVPFTFSQTVLGNDAGKVGWPSPPGGPTIEPPAPDSDALHRHGEEL